jgi:hypothetical protein
VENVLVIEGVEIAFAEREIIYSIEQIGFACPIMAHKAIDAW